ncbi:MAG: TPM domain-containing protein [Gammaproteobacteria bacterium]
MHAFRRGFAAFGLMLLFVAALALAQQPVPPRAARVTDLTNTLPAATQAALDRKLAAFEARKGSQIAVLLVATTAPESIEQYSQRVAEAWKLGRAGVDDGVLLLVAVQDRRARFEIGYGLEGAVPDALARRVIAEQLAPKFRDGDYAGGIDAGLDALIGLVEGEPLPEPAARAPDVEPWGAMPVLLIFAAFVAPLFRRIFGTLFGSLALGAGAGFIVWLVSSVLFASVLVGGLVFVFALAGIGGGAGRWASRGGPFGGMPGGFGGGFGGGGGGGFRGGGGRFGGGGASGGW